MIGGYVFDAYGTLFDVHSAVRTHADVIGAESDRLSAVWRSKQLELTWVRSLIGRYRDFLVLTEEALDFALATVAPNRLDLKPALMEAYRHLKAFGEAGSVLRAIKQRGFPVAILSNGTPRMLADAVAAAGLTNLVDHVISVDEVRIYKTAPLVYRLVGEKMALSPEATVFCSSNRWDIAGAVAFGFRAFWINRAGAPDEYCDLPPEAAFPTLNGVLESSLAS